MKRNSWVWWFLVSMLLLVGLMCVGSCMYTIHASFVTAQVDQRTPYVIASVVTGVGAIICIGGFTFVMCYAKRKDEQEFETL